MKVLLLGAGASKCACYPLASQLMDAVKAEAEIHSRGNVMLSKDWTDWSTFRDSANRAQGIAKALFSDPNPEVVLSSLDLCAACYSQISDVATARDARDSFLRCLEYFFQIKHKADSIDRWRRDYLRPVLEKLDRDDVVITFNWDTIVERTLYEDGGWRRWNPVTGYGFRKELRQHSGAALPDELDLPAEIRVLKLHGSVGWHELRRDLLYFGDQYLESFQFSEPGLEPPLGDSLAPECGPERRAVWAYPSFLKRLRGGEMREVWTLADDALRKAERVEVWGYSLPESDSAARVLLAPLALRLKSKEVSIRVHLYGSGPKNGKLREGWKRFLDDDECVDKQPLC